MKLQVLQAANKNMDANTTDYSIIPTQLTTACENQFELGPLTTPSSKGDGSSVLWKFNSAVVFKSRSLTAQQLLSFSAAIMMKTAIRMKGIKSDKSKHLKAKQLEANLKGVRIAPIFERRKNAAKYDQSQFGKEYRS
jgi:hypothetical protein